MSEFKSTRSRLFSLAIIAAVGIMSATGYITSKLHDAAAYAANAGFYFAVSIFSGFLRLAPARADELQPLERVKLLASESHSLAIAKRERPLIFAGWRMSPST